LLLVEIAASQFQSFGSDGSTITAPFAIKTASTRRAELWPGKGDSRTLSR